MPSQATEPYVGSDARVEIIVGDPERSIDGTVLAGLLFVAADGSVHVIHDRSGRSDVYPWRLLAGPVLRVSVLRPRRRRLDLFLHPTWRPREG